MLTHEIARRWTDFFEKKNHSVVPSASLVSPDPSLLFTVAGMVPFIPYFLGQQTPAYDSAVSIQKCIRTADIEEVGKTARHGTFFQMAGNFSFGDYFKHGAITMAWELLTTEQEQGGYGLDPQRLWVTVYEEDDEAYEIWRDVVKIPEARIQRIGKEDNYWHTGQPGPGGPCSEIFYDRGPEYGADGGPAVDDTRYLEIWNLVFMQYQLGDVRGQADFDVVGELSNKNIDTGLGVERLAMILQNVENMYETDQVRPVLDHAAKLAGVEYSSTENPADPNFANDMRLRYIADHIRSALMLISDSVTPGNEGRGYVLRRLIRRAVRAMRLLGVTKPVLPELLPTSRDAMRGSYPEVAEDFDRISRVAYAEERAFLRTIAAGTSRLEASVRQAQKQGTRLPGEAAFELHDTYGFPIDLTLEMAQEAGVDVDENTFRSLMQEQRDRARKDAKAKKTGHADTSLYSAAHAGQDTIFTGYTEHTTRSSIRSILVEGSPVHFAEQGQEVEIVLDTTPFYAEAGGQAADTGYITGDGFVVEVTDVQSPIKGLSVHRGVIREGEAPSGVAAIGAINLQRRLDAQKAHSATHIIHAALHQILGPEAVQAGSFNKEGFLRFDFKWQDALSDAARQEVEELSNIAIRDNFTVQTIETSLSEAQAMGAMSLFGEKYGDRVRVVEIDGAWSRELCGGTHVTATSEIGTLALLNEQSVGAGNRRIEALVGLDAFEHFAAERTLVNQLSAMLKTPSENIPGRIEQTLQKLREVEKELAQFKSQQMLAQAGSLVDNVQSVGDISLLLHNMGDVSGADDLRSAVTDLRQRLLQAGHQNVVVGMLGVSNERPLVVVAVDEGGQSKGLSAGNLVKSASQILGGGGGGKPDLAQGGGQDASKIEEALTSIRQSIENL